MGWVTHHAWQLRGFWLRFTLNKLGWRFILLFSFSKEICREVVDAFSSEIRFKWLCNVVFNNDSEWVIIVQSYGCTLGCKMDLDCRP